MNLGVGGPGEGMTREGTQGPRLPWGDPELCPLRIGARRRGHRGSDLSHVMSSAYTISDTRTWSRASPPGAETQRGSRRESPGPSVPPVSTGQSRDHRTLDPDYLQVQQERRLAGLTGSTQWVPASAPGRPAPAFQGPNACAGPLHATPPALQSCPFGPLTQRSSGNSLSPPGKGAGGTQDAGSRVRAQQELSAWTPLP